MASETLALLEMEGRLGADADGAYRDRICGQLNACAAEVRILLNSGLAPAEFAQASKLNDALTAAEEIVKARWQACARGTPCQGT